MRAHRNPHRDDRGVVAIELVGVLPFLLMLIMGILVVGNLLSVKAQANELAREGARLEALGLPRPAGTSIVSGECDPPVAPTDSVTVGATLDVSLKDIPLIPDDTNPIPEQITETVTMRCGG